MSIKVTGFEKIEKKLENLAKLEINVKPALRTIGEMVRNSIEDSFEKETSPFGERWKPLSSSTIFSEIRGGKKGSTIKSGKRHKKGFLKKYGVGGSRRILRRDGNLADNWVVEVGDSSVVVSNNTQSKNGFKYGLAHQFGANGTGRGKNGIIPARPFLPIDKNKKVESNLIKDIKVELENFILRAVK